MKQYQKAQMIAKNLPSGSYAAGCPTYSATQNPDGTRVAPSTTSCKKCEITK